MRGVRVLSTPVLCPATEVRAVCSKRTSTASHSCSIGRRVDDASNNGGKQHISWCLKNVAKERTNQMQVKQQLNPIQAVLQRQKLQLRLKIDKKGSSNKTQLKHPNVAGSPNQ